MATFYDVTNCNFEHASAVGVTKNRETSPNAVAGLALRGA